MDYPSDERPKKQLSGEFHLRLLETGKDAWNRWAITVIDHGELVKLGDKFSNIKPYSAEELLQLHQQIGLSSEQELCPHINLKGLKHTTRDFSGLLFPASADFCLVSYSSSAKFSDTIFIGAAYFSESTFQASADFDGCKFLNGVAFNNCHFEKAAIFTQCYVENYAHFKAAKFLQRAEFNHAIFNCPCDFNAASFVVADFKEALFKDVVFFQEVLFKSTTTFEQASFAQPPRFHDTELPQGTSFEFVTWLNRDGKPHHNRDSWRTLKHAMSEIHNHELELFFFKKEMESKAKTGATPQTMLLTVYRFVSDYGTSIWRPIVGLLALYGLFVALYASSGWNGVPAMTFEQAKLFAWGNMLPFTSISKATIASLPLEKEGVLGMCLIVTSSIQNILSAGFLFLTGLAIKHKLSLK